MKKKFLLLIAITSLFAVSTPAVSSTIFLSGDANIGSGIDGSSNATLTSGNSTFFSNILEGNTVLIQDEYYDGNEHYSTDAINTYYNSLTEVSSSLYTGTITGQILAGVDLFFSILPENVYSESEILALSNFLADGGTIFFMGENENLNHNHFSEQNSRINAALIALDSTMQLGSSILDPGFTTTTNIEVDLFTTGVTSFTLASTTNILGGGTSLLRTVNGGETFVAYENVNPIPEPATMLLFGFGLLGLAGISRKKK